MKPILQQNLWHMTCRERVIPAPMVESGSADLVVVGGGYTGCAAALAAASRGASVRLIEAREVGHGGSGRNVGLVNAGLWLPPRRIIDTLGQDSGSRLNSILAAGPARVFELIERHAIDCEPRRSGTLHLAHAAGGVDDLGERRRQLQAMGAPVTLLNAEQTAARTGAVGYHGALHDARAGTIQPLAYCRGLARAAAAAGAKIHQHCRVTGMAHDGNGWRVDTDHGTLRATALLVATNAYHLAVRGVRKPASTPVSYFQLSTAPLPAPLRDKVLPAGEGCWDTAPVMSSFRTDAAGRLLLGGIGDLDGLGSGVHRAWARRKLRALYPALSALPFESAWCGRIAMTADHLPKVLRLGKGALGVFGYSGRGIAPGTLFGEAAAAALLDDRDDLLPLAPVSGHREPLTGLRRHYYETGATLVHLLGAYHTAGAAR